MHRGLLGGYQFAQREPRFDHMLVNIYEPGEVSVSSHVCVVPTDSGRAGNPVGRLPVSSM